MRFLLDGRLICNVLISTRCNQPTNQTGGRDEGGKKKARVLCFRNYRPKTESLQKAVIAPANVLDDVQWVDSEVPHTFPVFSFPRLPAIACVAGCLSMSLCRIRLVSLLVFKLDIHM